MARRGLLIFRHDLRLHDHECLTRLAREVDELLCLFVYDARWDRRNQFQCRAQGHNRARFLGQSLAELHGSLQTHGQALHVVSGDPIHEILKLIMGHQITHVASHFHPGTYEQQDWRDLQLAVSRRHLDVLFLPQPEGHTLFTQSHLPFGLADLPKHFTPFRKRVEHLAYPEPLPAPERLPPPLAGIGYDVPDTKTPDPDHPFIGGENFGLQRLEHFLFETHAVAHYKETRNQLDGKNFSSMLSPWLTHGCLSVKECATQLHRFEQQETRNESTYWLYFELLWREYFQWLLAKYGSKFFQFSGLSGKSPLTSFYPSRFKQWISGSTPYPIVNACMHQLNATGYMSNRGRQLVASCLVNELELDWRYGAAFFEQQLIDYDVAVNWGNWQYIAGVGADPRGGRHFNLEKQAELYDPDGQFCEAWQGHKTTLALDSVDAADWPLV